MTAELSAASRAQASLELLYSISSELADQLDLRELLQSVLQLTLENIGAASGSIIVLDEEGEITDGALAYGGQVHDHTAEQLRVTYERGLAGWVVAHQKPVLVADTRDDERWLHLAGDDKDGTSRSAISVPLSARDRIVGVLTLVHPQAGVLTEEDLALLRVIADQAGIAVENARLFTAEQERRKLAATLQEIARTISSTLDPAQVFSHVLEQLERVVEYDSASIFLVENDELRLVAARGFEDGERLIGHKLQLDSNLIDTEMLRTREAMVIDDVQETEGWVQSDNISESHDIHGWIGAPLIVQDRVVGVLNVDSHRPGAYSRDDVEVVSAFADHAATAVANARLFAQSQRQVQATQALAEAARVVTASLELEDVLHRVLNQTMRSLGAEAASVALTDQENGDLEFTVATGEAADAVEGFQLQRGQGIAGWVAENEEAVLVEDVRDEPRFFAGVDELTGMLTSSLACAPIYVQGELIGVLEAINLPPDGMAAEQLELLKGIAGLAGTAIAHAQMFSETRSARERYAGLFNDSIDPILITDLQGRITEANLRAEIFLDYPMAERLGSSVLDLHEPDWEQLPRELGELAPGETISYESEVHPGQDRLRPVEVHVKRIDIDGEPYLQWILRDISERKELDELRADLTSMIFHDLRSPLGNVMSSLEMLQESIPEDDVTLQSVLSIAERSSRRLSRLVESLLDLGQLEQGQAVLHEQRASMGEIVREAVEEVEPLADAKGHDLSCEIGSDLPEVDLDVDMIRRVVINLLENAVKYTRSGGQIAVRAKRGEGEVLVRVTDNGPGISQSHQEQLFQKFSRVHHEGRPKGLGLGLAFCRLAVEAHSGRIWVESEEGVGTTFSFSLPVT